MELKFQVMLENIQQKVDELNAELATLDNFATDYELYQHYLNKARGMLAIRTATEISGFSPEEFNAKTIETLKSFKGKKIFNASMNGILKSELRLSESIKAFLQRQINV